MDAVHKYLISLDIGTTALKVGLFTVEGQMLAMATREQKLIFPQPGWVEQDPEHTQRLIAECCQQLLKDCSAKDVAALVISEQRGTVVPLDQTGKPLSNLIVWMDTRGAPYVKWVQDTIGSREYYQVCGHGLSYINGTGKVLWVAKETPEAWEKTAVVAPPQTLFLSWLGCEELVSDYSSATYTFPLEIERKVWSADLAHRMNYPLDRLPKLVGGTDIVGHLSASAAEQLGLHPGVPLVAGGGDGQCAAVGCGAIQTGLCMINIGTATGVQVFLPKPFWQESGAIGFGAHVLPEAWEMEEHTQASGVVLRWMRDELCQDVIDAAGQSGADPFDLLVDEARLVAPGSEGLVFIPTFNGVTGAHANPLARGVLLGLRLTQTRAHLLRAVLEGITYEIRWMLEAIKGTGAKVDQVRLVGGGSKNPHWNQIHADILGYPVSTLQNNEAALVGAAVCAAVGIGEYANAQEAVQQFVHIKECIQPNHPLRSIYDAAFDIFVKTYTLLSKEGVFDSLHAMIEKGESATI